MGVAFTGGLVVLGFWGLLLLVVGFVFVCVCSWVVFFEVSCIFIGVLITGCLSVVFGVWVGILGFGCLDGVGII